MYIDIYIYIYTENLAISRDATFTKWSTVNVVSSAEPASNFPCGQASSSSPQHLDQRNLLIPEQETCHDRSPGIQQTGSPQHHHQFIWHKNGGFLISSSLNQVSHKGNRFNRFPL